MVENYKISSFRRNLQALTEKCILVININTTTPILLCRLYQLVHYDFISQFHDKILRRVNRNGGLGVDLYEWSIWDVLNMMSSFTKIVTFFLGHKRSKRSNRSKDQTSLIIVARASNAFKRFKTFKWFFVGCLSAISDNARMYSSTTSLNHLNGLNHS